MREIISIGIVCITLMLCGCVNYTNESVSNDDIKYVSLCEIGIHPNRYINNTICVTAYWFGNDSTYPREYSMIGETTCGNIYVKLLDSVNQSILILGGRYYFTGILIHNPFILLGSELSINVIDVQPE